MDLAKAPELIDLMVSKHVYLNPTLVGGYSAISKRRLQYSQEDAQLVTQPLFAKLPEAQRSRIPKSYLRTDAMPPEKRQKLEESYQKVQAFIRDFSAKGGRILAASDATTDSMPGLATHREIQLLADAGVPAYEALLGATRYPAEYMRKQDVIGTVQAGRQADLLIVADSPLKDVGATQKVRYVIRKGTIEKRPPTN